MAKPFGERPQLAAFDARLKLLFAEQQVGGDIEEQHGDDVLLHYDLKVEEVIARCWPGNEAWER